MSDTPLLSATARNGERPPVSVWRGLVPALLLVLSVAGLGVSSYLTYTHWAEQTVVCGGVGNCELVQNSEYATLGPLPIALLGALMYAGLGGLAAITLRQRPSVLEWPSLLFWLGALGGTAYSAYLTYVELHVLEAICLYCVVSAGIISVSWLISSGYVAALIQAEPGEEPDE